MLKFTTLLILFIAAFASQDTPIPPKPEGYSLGSDTPTLHIEAFFDLLDPATKQSWDILSDLLVKSFLWQSTTFLVAQGAKVVAGFQDPDEIWTYIHLILQNQDLFSNAVEAPVPQSWVIDTLALGIHQEMFSPSVDVILQGLQYGTSYDYEARISWKYGCSRGVTDSPFYLANGVAIDGASSFTPAQWRNFLNGDY